MLDRLNSLCVGGSHRHYHHLPLTTSCSNAKFALPGLLYHNLATTNLYDAQWSVVGASIVFKVVTGAAFFLYSFLTRERFGPPAERALVSHSVLTFPNYVVIGTPVLSAMFPPATVKLFMSLLLMEQVSLHLTYVAVMAELCVKKPPAPCIGEHALGALHLHGPPLRTDAHGWALGAVATVLSKGGVAPAEAEEAGVVLEPRLVRRMSQTQLDAAAQPLKQHEAAELEPAGLPHAMPEHVNGVMRVLRIVRDRLLHSPLVIGAFAGVVTTLLVKRVDRKRPLPYILDVTTLYLQNCVLGISLFNFGLFAYVHGIVSVPPRRALEVVLYRSVLSPVCCALTMLAFGFTGPSLKIMIMQGALPQAVSSFVIFKEFRIQAETFSTSTNLSTLLCLPTMCVWYAIVQSIF